MQDNYTKDKYEDIKMAHITNDLKKKKRTHNLLCTTAFIEFKYQHIVM